MRLFPKPKATLQDICCLIPADRPSCFGHIRQKSPRGGAASTYALCYSSLQSCSMFQQMPWSRRRREYRERLAREEAEGKSQGDGGSHVEGQPSTEEQDRPPVSASQAASQSGHQAAPRVSGFTAINHRPPKPLSIPPDAEVIEISPSTSPRRSSLANQSTSQTKETPQKPNKPAPQPISAPEPVANRQPHTTFKPIKIHTAKCDVCNNHNKATLHRCVECGWQICTPCWNLRGSGAHGPTRTFTGPVFRESGQDCSRGNGGTAKDDDDTEAETIILDGGDGESDADGKKAGSQHFHTHGKAKSRADKNGASTETDSEDGSDSIPLARKRATWLLSGIKRPEDRNKVSNSIKREANNREQKMPLAGILGSAKCGFRDLTPTSSQSMHNLVTAAEQVLGGKANDGASGLSSTANRNCVNPARPSESPLFVPTDTGVTMPRLNALTTNSPSLAGRANHGYNAPRSKQLKEPYRPPTQGSSQASFSSSSVTTVGPARAATTSTRLPPMGEFSIRRPQPYKRQRSSDADRAVTLSDPAGRSGDSTRTVEVPLRPAKRSNTRGRAWEL